MASSSEYIKKGVTFWYFGFNPRYHLVPNYRRRMQGISEGGNPSGSTIFSYDTHGLGIKRSGNYPDHKRKNSELLVLFSTLFFFSNFQLWWFLIYIYSRQNSGFSKIIENLVSLNIIHRRYARSIASKIYLKMPIIFYIFFFRFQSSLNSVEVNRHDHS